VATSDPSCPVCHADVPLAGDERAGAEIYCAYCHAPCRLTKDAGDDDCELEEDF
jgi:hypothetical protein